MGVQDDDLLLHHLAPKGQIGRRQLDQQLTGTNLLAIVDQNARQLGRHRRIQLRATSRLQLCRK